MDTMMTGTPPMPQGGNNPGGNSSTITDTSMQSFGADVIEASQSRPVIVDIWSERSAACKQLIPALEAAVTAAGGAVALAKVNADQNQQLCAQLQVQSLPTVIAFWQGQPVDGFQGPLPPDQIKAFIDKLVALGGGGANDPVAAALEQADELLAIGEQAQTEQAVQIYQQILAHDPNCAGAVVGMAEAAIKLDQLEQAREIAAMLTDENRKDAALKDRVERIEASLELAAQAENAGDIEPLLQAVEADPQNHQARFDLALAYQAAGDMNSAADALLAIIMRDREWNEDGARAHLLKLFEAAGPTDPFTQKYRRRLSSVLFS